MGTTFIFKYLPPPPLHPQEKREQRRHWNIVNKILNGRFQFTRIVISLNDVKLILIGSTKKFTHLTPLPSCNNHSNNFKSLTFGDEGLGKG